MKIAAIILQSKHAFRRMVEKARGLIASREVKADQLKKKKQAKALDPRLNSQLENAIYACNPPVVTSKEVEKKPPLEAYIDRLLFSDFISFI